MDLQEEISSLKTFKKPMVLEEEVISVTYDIQKMQSNF